MHCPICGKPSAVAPKDENDNWDAMYVALDYNGESGGVFDHPVVLYRCHSSHRFYVPTEEN